MVEIEILYEDWLDAERPDFRCMVGGSWADHQRFLREVEAKAADRRLERRRQYAALKELEGR